MHDMLLAKRAGCRIHRANLGYFYVEENNGKEDDQ
jgi:hypothetical protein